MGKALEGIRRARLSAGYFPRAEHPSFSRDRNRRLFSTEETITIAAQVNFFEAEKIYKNSVFRRAAGIGSSEKNALDTH